MGMWVSHMELNLFTMFYWSYHSIRTQNRGYSCFQIKPTTKVFISWLAPVLFFINFHIGIYLNQHTLNLWDRKCWKDFSFPFKMVDNLSIMLIFCRCFDGFRQPEPDVDICQDINECTQHLHRCATEEGAICKNTKGNYTCECPPGFEEYNWIHCKG